MPVYTIRQVADQTRQWVSSRGDAMTSYRLQLDDGKGAMLEAVELSQKSSTPAPKPGDTLDAEVSQNGDFGLKAKKNYASGGGGGGGRPKSPAEQASIAASVALKWAVEAVDQAATFGTAEKPQTLEEHVALLKRYADWGCKYIESKAKAAA